MGVERQNLAAVLWKQKKLLILSTLRLLQLKKPSIALSPNWKSLPWNMSVPMLLQSLLRSVLTTLIRLWENGNARLMTSWQSLKHAGLSLAIMALKFIASKPLMMRQLNSLMWFAEKTRTSLINWEMEEDPSMSWTSSVVVLK